MEIQMTPTYAVTMTMSHHQLDDIVSTIEDLYMEYIKKKGDIEDIKPLLEFKDNLVLAFHSATGQNG